MMATFEKAIDYLDKKGVIDRDRIGIIGFSRTCFYVKYMLTHSGYHIAAAVVADGIDGGYFQYIAFANMNPSFAAEDDALIGAPPFGDGLAVWREQSPGFLLDRVETPVLVQAILPYSLLGQWEWFSGLRRLGKPVEMLYLPTGTHILQKPWDRRASQQGTVDWLCYWLKGEEDPDPAKAEQYARWRELSKLHEQNKALERNQNK